MKTIFINSAGSVKPGRAEAAPSNEKSSRLVDYYRGQSRIVPKSRHRSTFSGDQMPHPDRGWVRIGSTRRLEAGGGQPGEQQQHEHPQIRPPVPATGQDR